MAIDSLLSSYEHALILSSYPANLPHHSLLYSLVVNSEYANILQRYKPAFRRTSSRLSIHFEEDTRDLEKLICGIAALQAFIQTNWTGPEVDLDPSDLFEGDAENHEWDTRAVVELAVQGEPAYHLTKKAGFLWLAKEIFALPELAIGETLLQSLPVWRLRLGLVNLRLLETPVAFSESLVSQVEAYIDSLPYTYQRQDLQTSLTLLIGIFHAQFIHYSSSATKLSSETFYSAAKIAAFEYDLTGRMGKRTKWQIDEKSQLVVLARSRQREDSWVPRESMLLKPQVKEDSQIPTNSEADPNHPKALLLNDDTLLERPHFTSTAKTSDIDGNSVSSLDPNKQPHLHPLDQCILLALSLSISNTSPLHGLLTSEIQAFVARVLNDGSQNWSVHSMALLLRSRLEANRSRTVERGLLQMQSLADQLKLESTAKPKESHDLNEERGATVLERLKYFWNLDLPTIWELERELATRYLGLGVVRSAMEIFTRLEMWEDVAKCYSAMGEPEKAVQIVKDLLEGNILESEATMAMRRGVILNPAQKAKLWCLLGDLERNSHRYKTAWETSAHTSSRAIRSLGQHYFSTEQYKSAQTCLEKALAINPLFVKVWFVLGCCAMRTEDWPVAERAFRRCTSLEEDDAESWNNLATVLLKQTRSTGSSHVDEEEREINHNRKLRAYTCLSQAIKHSYDSWRIWVNYLLVCVDVGELMEACRAMGRLAELRADKDGENAIDLDVLDRLVDVTIKEKDTMKQSLEGLNDEGWSRVSWR